MKRLLGLLTLLDSSVTLEIRSVNGMQFTRHVWFCTQWKGKKRGSTQSESAVVSRVAGSIAHITPTSFDKLRFFVQIFVYRNM